MITATGWTWGAVDDLTLGQLAELFDYWAECQPLHELVAGIAKALGFERKRKSKQAVQQVTTEDEMQRLAAFLNGAL